MVNGEILTHTTWEQCEKRVKGVKNTKFKKAMSLEDEQNIIREWRKISHI
jgi:viroplasmin and RNaseH domain-containing protein